jgi:UPF0271 protein
MIKEGKVTAVSGEVIGITPDTVCIHGDGPQAVDFARHLHEALQAEDIVVRAVM